MDAGRDACGAGFESLLVSTCIFRQSRRARSSVRVPWGVRVSQLVRLIRAKNRLFQEVCLRQIQLILTVALGVSEIRWARLLDGGLFNTGLWEGNKLQGHVLPGDQQAEIHQLVQLIAEGQGYLISALVPGWTADCSTPACGRATYFWTGTPTPSLR